MSQIAADCAEQLESAEPDDRWGSIFKTTCANVVAINKADLKWALRSFIAIFINFVVGYVGWCNHNEIDEDAAIANSTNMTAKLALVGKSRPSCFINPRTSGLANINVVLLSRYSAAFARK